MATAKPDTRIINRGRGHSYLLDGKKVSGVTTIINAGVPKPALVGWAARTVSEYVIERLQMKDGVVTADELLSDLRAFNDTRKWPEKLGEGLSRVGMIKVLSQVQYADRDAAANRGTEVHRLADELGRGEEVTVPDEIKGHIESYLRFLDEFQPTDALLERVVINRRWQYMGRLDAIATLPGLGRTLYDIKTSRSGPYGDAALQLAGYRYAETLLTSDGLAEEPMPEVDSCAVVWIRADGYDVYPFQVDESVHRIFLYAKQIADSMDQEAGFVANAKGEALPVPVLEPAQ
jgi:hypothetical protein